MCVNYGDLFINNERFSLPQKQKQIISTKLRRLDWRYSDTESETDK